MGQAIKLTGGRSTNALADMPSVRYRPIERVRQSDEVVVYRCFDTLRERPVELHIAPSMPEALARVDIVARMQALAKLEIEGLRPVYEHGFHVGRPFLVMPAAPGRSIGDLTAIPGAPLISGELMLDGMGATAVASAALQVAIALESLHTMGQAHGGLTVASIRVDHGGRAILEDFGLLRACATRKDELLAMADDIRQLGVVLMSLTLGGDTSEDGDERTLRALLDRLIDRMISPDLSIRPTADRLVDELERALEAVPAPTQPWIPSTRSLAPRKRRAGARLPSFRAAPLAGVDPDATEVSGVDVDDYIADKDISPSLLGTFINTISVCSARWQVGKRHPDITDLVMRRGWGRAESVKAPPRAIRPMLLVLLLAATTGWHFDLEARQAGAEPPEAPLVTATVMAASTLAPAVDAITYEPEVTEIEADVDVEQPQTASMVALRPGEAPRVVHYRAGVAVGHVAKNPYERRTIPERAYPVAALGALRMARPD